MLEAEAIWVGPNLCTHQADTPYQKAHEVICAPAAEDLMV